MKMKPIEEQKRDLITKYETEIWDVVRPILERQTEEYKKVFGGFTMTDQWLWHNLSIDIEVTMAACDAVDVEDD